MHISTFNVLRRSFIKKLIYFVSYVKKIKNLS
jgi:hypothetical protein